MWLCNFLNYHNTQTFLAFNLFDFSDFVCHNCSLKIGKLRVLKNCCLVKFGILLCNFDSDDVHNVKF